MLAALAALVLEGGVARADLADDAGRLAAHWSRAGAKVTRLEPMFLERGRARTFAPLAPGSGPLAPTPEAPGCLTVALIAVRTAELSVIPTENAAAMEALTRLRLPPIGGREVDGKTHSAGGVAVVSRCGASRVELGRLTAEIGSARGAVEIVVARSDAPLADLRDALPERSPGPVAPRGDAGGPLEPGPLAERLARAEGRARAEGAEGVSRVSLKASPRGVGGFELDLPEGCHRLEVMADIPTAVPHRGTDVDAEVHERATGRLLARDRADVPDARLDFCLGEPTPVGLAFSGAAGPVTVTLSKARWPLPAKAPARWGAKARAGLAGALRRRHAPVPEGDLFAESMGAAGLTSIPVEVEPGRCYLVGVALLRGEARTLRLSVPLGDRVLHDDGGERDGAVVGFCVEAQTSISVEVDARGNGPGWALGVWSAGAAAP